MSVDTHQRLDALVEDLGSQASVARLLGVSSSQVSRWVRNATPDDANRRKLEGAEFVMTRLLDVYGRETAIKWLHGANAHLGGRPPADLLATGRVAEVLAALEAHDTGAYA